MMKSENPGFRTGWILFIGSGLVISGISSNTYGGTEKGKSAMPEKVAVTVTYNNVLTGEGFAPAWGFSCFIEGAEKGILFDTGGEGSILLSNMKKLGIDPARVEVVFLSHIHGDHTGGLGRFLEMNPEVAIYLPQSFPGKILEGLTKTAEKVVRVGEPVELCPGVWSTGEMGTWIKEQSLAIETRAGLVVITGCAHPGITEIIRKAKDILGGPVFLVMGGFHLMGYGAGDMEKIVRRFKDLEVRKVGPSHCTGDEQIELFRKAWGEDFLDLGLGGRIEIE